MHLRNDKVNLSFRIIVLKIHVLVLRNTFFSEPNNTQTYNELKCEMRRKCTMSTMTNTNT